MLQQTQTSRVSDKFLEFIRKFPNFQSLSNASLEDVLTAWQGLGYNRRAIALKKIADDVIEKYDGQLPKNLEMLKSFPQIGHNTASSILSFAFNIPTYFIETNIRRVYLYFFFQEKKEVIDKEIIEIVKKTIDLSNPRKWYYALMDYGVMLKKTHPELNKKSVHYRRQSKFKGSNREIRGKILKILLKNGPLQQNELIQKLNNKSDRIRKILSVLLKEGFVIKQDKVYSISE